MKKIGILFGQERSFPMAFIERVNNKKIDGIRAEPVLINKVIQGELSQYAVIIDRISHDIPFYRAFLKNASLGGTAVINNPFWSSADEKFFNNSLAVKLGLNVPKTVILPSYEIPENTTPQSFSNLSWPLQWDEIFDYVGFPAYMKPFEGGGWKNVYRIIDKQDFYRKHPETGRLVMLLQEEIIYEEYYRCYCIGGKYVKVMSYDPRNPFHLRYVTDFKPDKNRLDELEAIVLRLNQFLGYDFNTVELAIRDGVPYAIDFCNPVPDAEITSVGQENFDWVVETAASYAIERALEHETDRDNLTWGEFLRRSLTKKPL